MLVIGIDPGISGSICFFQDGKINDVVEMPTMIEGKKNKKQVNGSQIFNEISYRTKKIDKKEASRLINSEVINEGMIPKVRGALEAIEAGVDSVQIIDGSEQHALLLELFTDAGIGSQLT